MPSVKEEETRLARQFQDTFTNSVCKNNVRGLERVFSRTAWNPKIESRGGVLRSGSAFQKTQLRGRLIDPRVAVVSFPTPLVALFLRRFRLLKERKTKQNKRKPRWRSLPSIPTGKQEATVGREFEETHVAKFSHGERLE